MRTAVLLSGFSIRFACCRPEPRGCSCDVLGFTSTFGFLIELVLVRSARSKNAFPVFTLRSFERGGAYDHRHIGEVEASKAVAAWGRRPDGRPRAERLGGRHGRSRGALIGPDFSVCLHHIWVHAISLASLAANDDVAFVAALTRTFDSLGGLSGGA